MMEDRSSNSNNNNSVGVIIPPPEIKGILEKTADFIRRATQEGGEEKAHQLETHIRARNRSEAKFNFLNTDSPYHAFYRLRVRGEEVEESAELQEHNRMVAAAAAASQTEKPTQNDDDEKQVDGSALAAAEVSLSDKIMQLHLDVKREKMTVNEAPPPDQFVVQRPPSSYSNEDVDIIKLTAQFLGRNGRQFLSIVQSREQHNSRFDFLKVSHPLFSYFSQLAGAYAQIVIGPQDLLTELKKDLVNPQRVVDRVLARRTWEEAKMLKEREEASGIEEERRAMALIDWHDFVAVEKVEFRDDQDLYLPSPCTSIEEMNALFMRQAELEKEQQAKDEGDGGSGDDMDMDMDMDVDDDAKPVEERKHVVRTSMNRALGKDQKDLSNKFQKCPICSQLVRVEDISEHIRIELLDPKWKEQKNMLQNRETSLNTSGDSISANLSRIARKRADIFIDTSDAQTKRRLEAEEKARKANVVMWDGQNDTIEAAVAAAKVPTPTAATVPPSQPPQPPPSKTPHAAIPQPPQGGGYAQFPPQAQPPPMQMQPPPPMRMQYPGGGFGRGPPPPQQQHMMGFAPPPMPPPPGVTTPDGRLMGFPPQGGAPPPAMMMQMQPQVSNTQEVGVQGYNPEDGPVLKRVRPNDDELVNEKEFASQFEKEGMNEVLVIVKVPNDESKKAWNFNGQRIEMTLPLSAPLSAIKTNIAKELGGMPHGKQKLRYVEGKRFLKGDNAGSLALHNLAPPSVTLELTGKERGRRKK